MSTYIKSVNIKHFGGLSDAVYTFEKGVNVIEGANESGKSTLAFFIKFLFYGFSDKNERERWTSFEYGTAQGWAIVCKDGIDYRIERQNIQGARATGKDTLSITDLQSGKECFVGEVPGEVFFNIKAHIYPSVLFCTQKGVANLDGTGIKQAIENMLLSGNEGVNTKNALDKLDSARVKLLHKNKKGGLIYELACRANSLSDNLNDSVEKSGEIKQVKKELSELNERNKYLSEREKLLDNCRKLRVAKSIVNTFNDINEQKVKMNSLSESLEQVRKESSYNGFLPDGNYITNLNASNYSLNLYSDNLNEAIEKYNTAKQEFDKFSSKYPLASRNLYKPKDDVINKAENIKQRIRLSTVFFIFFAVVTFIWAICTLVFGLGLLNREVSVIIPGIIAGVFAIASIITFIILKNRKKKMKCMLSEYGCEDYDGLPRRLDEVEGVKMEYARLSGEEKQKYENMLLEKKKFDTLIERTNAELEKWGKHIEKKEDLKYICTQAKQVSDGIIGYEAGIRECMQRIGLKTDSVKGQSFEKACETLKLYDGREDIVNSDAYCYDIQSLDSELYSVRRELDKNNRIIAEHTGIYTRLISKIGDPSEIKKSLDEIYDRIKKYTRIHDAYLLAYETIVKASENVRNNISPELSRSVSDVMSETQQKDYSYIAGGDFALSFRRDESDTTHKADYLSGGTNDLLYISLRLSLAKILCGNHNSLMIFDETFSQIDDSRLENILSLLIKKEEEMQFIILTCNDRENRMLSSLREEK